MFFGSQLTLFSNRLFLLLLLFVVMSARKIQNHFVLKLVEGADMGQGGTHYILVQIQNFYCEFKFPFSEVWGTLFDTGLGSGLHCLTATLGNANRQ